MEEWEDQEIEFWRKLDEEGMSRAQVLRRSAAAAAGLTVLASPAAALAASGRTLKTPPRSGKAVALKEMVAQAKKEGHLNTIALPPDWSNYGEQLSTFKKKFGIPITNDNPDGSSSQENQAIVSLKGDKRAPDVVDVNAAFAVQGTQQGLYARYFIKNFSTIPRVMKDTRGYWWGDYWGAISIGYNQNIIKTPPRTFKDLLNSDYRGKVALNGSPLTSGSAIAGVFAAAIANGGSLSNIQPGIDFFAQLKKVGNFNPIQGTPQTVASGQTPIVIDWDYLNIAYGPEFPAAKWKATIPSDGVYGAYYCQAINATAPHPWAGRLWEEFLFSDQGQLIFLKGYAHPARFTDLVGRKVVPKALLAKLPSAKLYAKVRFASLGQQTKAKALVADQWNDKVGG